MRPTVRSPAKYSALRPMSPIIGSTKTTTAGAAMASTSSQGAMLTSCAGSAVPSAEGAGPSAAPSTPSGFCSSPTAPLPRRSRRLPVTRTLPPRNPLARVTPAAPARSTGDELADEPVHRADLREDELLVQVVDVDVHVGPADHH